MEEMLDEPNDNDIPMDDIHKKNIKIFKAQGKPTKLHTYKTNITGKKMSDCSSVDFIDSGGNLVSVDSDFSRDAEVHNLVKQTLKIEMQKIEDDTDYKAKEKVARAFITRFEREERKDE
jgi:copper(I)-binding protein